MYPNSMIDKQMERKNLETAGGYFAKASGDKGELEISTVLKSLPDCYHVMDNILLQTRKGRTQTDHVVVLSLIHI